MKIKRGDIVSVEGRVIATDERLGFIVIELRHGVVDDSYSLLRRETEVTLVRRPVREEQGGD